MNHQDARALAKKLNLDFQDLADFSLDGQLLSLMPVEWMIRFTCIPLGAEGNQLKLAFADPQLLDHIEELEMMADRRVSLVLAPSDQIDKILKESQSSQKVLQDATTDFRRKLMGGGPKGTDVLDIDRLVDDASPLVRLVDTVIYNALERRASDIHIETGAEQVIIKFRIDGVLYLLIIRPAIIVHGDGLCFCIMEYQYYE